MTSSLGASPFADREQTLLPGGLVPNVATPKSPVTEEVEDGTISLARRGMRIFFGNRLAVAGLIGILVIVGACLIGPLVMHADTVHTDLARANESPSTAHLLGTDNVGRDELAELFTGGRSSIAIASAAALLAILVGTLWGAIAGYIGGVVDSVMMRVVDAVMAIPGLFLLIVLASMLQVTTTALIVILGAISWLATARLVRGEALVLRTREFVQAARVMRASNRRVIGRHILPNAVGTIVVSATFQVADAVLTLAGLSFLGLGVPPPSTDWGNMLSVGVQYAYVDYWWLILPPGLAIVVFILCVNFVGEGLKDAFEVRLSR